MSTTTTTTTTTTAAAAATMRRRGGGSGRVLAAALAAGGLLACGGGAGARGAARTETTVSWQSGGDGRGAAAGPAVASRATDAAAAAQVVDYRERELAALRAQIAATPAGDPHRGDLLARLADLLREGSLPALPGPERTAVPNSPRAVERRGELIRTLTELTDRYPQHARADEAYFYLAYASESARDMTAARRYYLTLIQRFPSSRLVPFAYLSFAEFFIGESAWPEAQQFLERVATFGGLAPAVRAYTEYQLGWAAAHQQNGPAALDHGRRALAIAASASGDRDAARVAERVRADAPAAYVEALGPSAPFDAAQAADAFRQLTGDPAAALELLARTGARLEVAARWAEAARAFERAAAGAPGDPRAAEWHTRAADDQAHAQRP